MNLNATGEMIFGIPENLKPRYKTLANNLLNEVGRILGNEEYFVGIYGSYANSMCGHNSDLDVIVGVESKSRDLLSRLAKTVSEFHSKNKLGIDNEVPYSSKLLVDRGELYNSSNLKGINVDTSGKVVIPPIVKSMEFLGSEKLKFRLLFNILTTPLIYSGNKVSLLKDSQLKAEQKLLLLSIIIFNESIFRITELLSVLFKSSNGESGELYLGYKEEYPKTADYLRKILEEQIQLLIMDGYLEEIEEGLFKIRKSININDFIYD